MDSNSLYQDIAVRTNGDIYIGVVGPVRSGKSTFLKKFMDKLVLPSMQDMPQKQRVIDELPQSGDGKSIMTTEPKFVPDKGVNIDLASDVNVNVRLIDCVGYMIDGVENSDRLVKTPWSDQEMTFTEAAELGTRKVMCDHCTIGVVVTTDGSVTEFGRSDYVAAEESIIREMQKAGKPFIVLLNTAHPTSEGSVNLAKELSAKYGVTVLPKNVAEIDIEDIQEMLMDILGEFPLKVVNVSLPRWVQMLNIDNPLVAKIKDTLLNAVADMSKMCDYIKVKDLFREDSEVQPIAKYNVEYRSGSISLDIQLHDNVFYQVLSNICGVNVADESELFRYIKQSTVAVSAYESIAPALDSVQGQGYGIMLPQEKDIEYLEPEFVEQGGKKSIKMSAKCTCLHIMKVDINAEVNPVMATGVQGQEMVTYLEQEYQDNPSDIWHTNMLGKELCEIAKDNLNAKMYNMPQDAKDKLTKTVSRIVNESKGGVLCVLL